MKSGKSYSETSILMKSMMNIAIKSMMNIAIIRCKPHIYTCIRGSRIPTMSRMRQDPSRKMMPASAYSTIWRTNNLKIQQKSLHGEFIKYITRCKYKYYFLPEEKITQTQTEKDIATDTETDTARATLDQQRNN